MGQLGDFNSLQLLSFILALRAFLNSWAGFKMASCCLWLRNIMNSGYDYVREYSVLQLTLCTLVELKMLLCLKTHDVHKLYFLCCQLLMKNESYITKSICNANSSSPFLGFTV